MTTQEAPGADTAPARGRSSLARQVARARAWLPLAIVGVVLVWQLLLVPQVPEAGQGWAELLFYSLLGPTATFVTLDWIARQVEARERAQRELTLTYHQLQNSHALLASIQRVTERFAAATDLETAVRAAVQGLREATGAAATAVVLGPERAELVEHEALPDALADPIRRRDTELRAGRPPAEVEGEHWILSTPIRRGDTVEGSLHAVFRQPPDARQREAFGILAGEFASAAEAARSRMRDLLTLFDVDRSIRAEGNLERLLEALLTRMMRRAGAARGAVYLADGSATLQARVIEGAASAAPIRLGEGWVGRAAASGEPALRTALQGSDRLEMAPLLDGAGTALALPLHAERELLGLVVLAHEQAGRLDRAHVPFLQLVAGQVSLALRNARAYLYSEELAIGDERSRIAREIHDGAAQTLAFTALKVDLAKRYLRSDPDAAERELGAVKEAVRETIKELRRSIFALRPVDLERHGLEETLRRYLDDFGEQNDVGVETRIGSLPELELRNEAVLFRIFQEAMHNVAKHARARSVRVALGTDEAGRAFVEVVDDGVGFDPEEVGDRVTSAGGLGLRQMRERVEDRGGTFTVDAAPGQGTRVRASVV